MDNYRKVIIAQKETEWPSKDGSKIMRTRVVLTSSESKPTNCPGEWSRTSHGLNIDWEWAFDDGKWQSGSWITEIDQKNEGGLVASLGKIGLTQDRLDQLNDLRSQIETHPVWQEHLANTKDGEAADKEYYAHVRRVDNMMTGGSN